MVFDYRIFEHIIEKREKEGLPIPAILKVCRTLFKNRFFSFLISIFEKALQIFLCLPIPFYSDIVLFFITYLPGTPHFLGNYLRAIYYSHKLKECGRNVIIDEGVRILNPSNTSIGEFSWIDKGVILGASEIKIGKRVHISSFSLIVGTGRFIIEDYGVISLNVVIITSSDVPKDGARVSGPMVPIKQRNLKVGDVIIKKDGFVGAGSIIMPGVKIGEGGFVGASQIIFKDVPPWKIVFAKYTDLYVEKEREKVKHADV
jgi:galactoside O-acetyltransferase